MPIDRRRAARAGLALAAAAVLSATGGWAARTALGGPDRETVGDEPYVLVASAPGAVQDALSLNASAQWTSTDAVNGLASGVVTGLVHEDGALLEPGAILYTVDLQPVVAAEGDVPAFRALAQGLEGDDVAQLQRLLAAEGHYDGEAHGDFDHRTAQAVRAWQRTLGVEPTGTVEAGSVLFAPDLPARATLADGIDLGAAAVAGDPAVAILPDQPAFTIALPEGQAQRIAPGMAVDLPRDGGTWHAVVADITTTDDGQTTAVLTGADGPVCADTCDAIPTGPATLLPATIHIVPEVEGITIPAAAVTTDATGRTAVVTATGTEIPVEVLAGADGLVVVTGLDAGIDVRLPGRAPA